MREKTKKEVHPQAREFFDKGITALRKDNLDYATKLFEQALRREPGFFECREALRLNQFMRSGKKSGLFKMFGKTTSTSLLPKGQLALKKDPLEAIVVAEQVLNDDPYSVMGNKLLAEAATAAEFPRTALFAWDLVMQKHPDDKTYTMRYCQALVNNGDVVKAEEICTALAKVHPGDQEVLQLSKNLDGQPEPFLRAATTRLSLVSPITVPVLKDEAEAVLLEQENRRSEQESTAENLIKEYELRLVDEPENLKLIRSLAELQSRVKDFDKSIGYYERFNKTNLRSDAAVDRAILDTKLLQFDWQIEQACQGDASELEVDRRTFEMEQMQHLSDMYPSDLSLRYDLGVLQFEAGEITRRSSPSSARRPILIRKSSR